MILMSSFFPPLTRKLLKKVGANQSDDIVKKFIEEKLQWRVYAVSF
jgi:hypothetical protein